MIIFSCKLLLEIYDDEICYYKCFCHEPSLDIEYFLLKEILTHKKKFASCFKFRFSLHLLMLKLHLVLKTRSRESR